MRMNAVCLLGTLSAAAILAACAERRTYNDQVSTYDRDRGYTSGWTSGSYVAGTTDTTYNTGSTGYQSGYRNDGYQSGYQQGGYQSGTNFDTTNRVSGYGSSDSFNTGTSSSTTYGSTNNGMNNQYGNRPYDSNNQYGNQPSTGTSGSTTYGNQPYGNQPYGTQPATGTTGTYGTATNGTYGGTNGTYGTGTNGTGTNGTYGTGTTTTGGGYGNTGNTYEKSGTLSSSWSSVRSAVAVFHPIEGNNCKGTLRFTPSGRGLHVTADLEGLKPNQKVALRIHEFGDCSSLGGDSTGGNFGGNMSNGSTSTTYGTGSNVNSTGSNVDNSGTSSNGTMSSGGMNGNMSGMQHVGELVNLESDGSGRLHIDQDIDNVSLVNGDNAILGRSVVLETLGDTSVNAPSYGTSGNGTRIACGVIGIGKADNR